MKCHSCGAGDQEKHDVYCEVREDDFPPERAPETLWDPYWREQDRASREDIQ